MNERTTGEASLKASTALIDILIIVAVSAVGYFTETWAREAGLITLGEDSRGFIAVLAGAAAALLMVMARGQRFSEIGFRRPKRWWTVPFWVVGIVFASISIQLLVSTMLAPFFDQPEVDLSRYAHIYQNLPAALFMAMILPLTASIPEEIIYRGFLINRLTHIFGAGFIGVVLTVVVQSLIFGAVHFEWGLGGMIMTSIMGLVWASAYLLCGRNLWIVIIAHSTAHILLVVQLYTTPLP